LYRFTFVGGWTTLFWLPDWTLQVKMPDAEAEKALAIKNANGEMEWLAKLQIMRRVWGSFIEIAVPARLADKTDLEFEDGRNG
jgi:hypothetical protein